MSDAVFLREPAFPTPYVVGNGGTYTVEFDSGLTKRELFAAMAMHGFICADPKMKLNARTTSELALMQADALIEALK